MAIKFTKDVLMKIIQKIVGLFSLIILFSSCSHVFYQPTPYFYSDPVTQFGVNVENIYFPSLDGTELHAWYMKSPKSPKSQKSKGLVVFFHGNAENLTSHYRALVWMLPLGYDLLIFDYRGYGRSKGDPDQAGVYMDAIAALRYARNLQLKNNIPKFIVYGQSLGGIVAMRAIFDFLDRDKINLVVMDSTFSSYQNIAFDKLTDHWYLYPFSPLAYLLVSDKMESQSYISKLDRPLLVIHGEADGIIPPKFGQKIYDLAPSSLPKWIWRVPQAGHIESLSMKNGEYKKKLVDLIEGLP
jgi:hypothetical protein